MLTNSSSRRLIGDARALLLVSHHLEQNALDVELRLERLKALEEVRLCARKWEVAFAAHNFEVFDGQRVERQPCSLHKLASFVDDLKPRETRVIHAL